MNVSDLTGEGGLTPGGDPNGSNLSGLSSGRSNAFMNKLTSILSGLYADSDIRAALEILDSRSLKNDAETRRRLRLDTQKEVIDCNGSVVHDFGKVAEVGSSLWPTISSC